MDVKAVLRRAAGGVAGNGLSAEPNQFASSAAVHPCPVGVAVAATVGVPFLETGTAVVAAVALFGLPGEDLQAVVAGPGRFAGLWGLGA